jgi:hypothetical protein
MRRETFPRHMVRRDTQEFHGAFSVLSLDADIARFPSGVTATPWMKLEWPCSVRGRHRHAMDRIRVALQRARASPPRHGPNKSGLAACAARGRSSDPTPKGLSVYRLAVNDLGCE